jgi:hypothetical protein
LQRAARQVQRAVMRALNEEVLPGH